MSQITEKISVPDGEPNLDTLGGDALSKRVKRAFLATRPKFLTASILPVILGTGWGFRVAGEVDWLVFCLALLATALVHAASNVWNDVGDDSAGSDAVNDERIHPYTGGSRFIQNGILSNAEMHRLSVLLGLAAILLGATLIWLKGFLVLVLGAIGIALGYLYSSANVRLSGRGIGEVAVAIAFGTLPVCGAAWLQSSVVDWATVGVSIPVSCWVACILLINEVPDIRADAATGKRTIAVRLGATGTAITYFLLQIAAFLAVLMLVDANVLSPLVLILCAVLVLVGWAASRNIPTGDRASLRKGIEMTLGIHALGCIWLAGWAWFSIPGQLG